MEPLKISYNSSINSNFSSGLLTVKQEIIDKTDHNNKNQLSQIGTEAFNSIDTEIKIEKDVIEGYVFEGTVFSESHASEFITCMNSDKKHNLLENPMTSNVHSIAVSNLSRFQVNKKLQTRLDNHICIICDKLFNSNTLLKRHAKIHNSKREKKFICDICNKSYYKSDLITHILLHNVEKPYKCDICDKLLKSKALLTLHNKIHTIKRRDPFICDYMNAVSVIKDFLVKNI